MENQISKEKLIKYLSQQVIYTEGYIIRCSNSLNRRLSGLNLISKSDDICLDTLEMYREVQNLLNDIESYRFRLQWLESQINEVKKDLDISK